MTMTMTVSNACGACSFADHVVVHGTPWCPRVPAVAWVDLNGARPTDDGLVIGTLAKHLSRPVEAGEVVVLIDEFSLVGWGRVQSIDGNLVRIVEFHDGWSTAKVAAA